jgi:hypothetical protein
MAATLRAAYYANATDSGPVTVPSVAVTAGDRVYVFATWRDSAGHNINACTFGGSSTGLSQHYDPGAVIAGIDGECYVGVGLSGTQSVVVSVTSAGGVAQGVHVTVFVVIGAGSEDAGVTVEGEGDPSVAASVTSAADDLILAVTHMRGNFTSSAEYTSPATRQSRGVDSDAGNTHCGGVRAGAGGSTTITCTFTNPSFDNSRIFAFNVVASGGDPADPPTITNVDTDNSITATQTNVTITGTDFDTATVDLEQGGNVEAQSIDSQNATTIQFDVSQGDVKYGSATIRVTNGDAQDDTQAVTLAPPSGFNFVDLASVETVGDDRITAVADLEIGDQIEWSNVQGGDVSDVTVNDDGTFECDAAVTAFDVRVWDGDDETWGSIATQTITEPGDDETPDAFSLGDAPGVERSSVNTSDLVTVAGLGSGITVDVAITGGTYSKNGAGYVSTAGTATNGDTFRVRGTASGSYATPVNVELDIGTGSDTYTITTRAEDVTPAGFTFTDQTGLARSTQVESDLVTVSGLDSGTSVAVSIAGTGTPEYSKNGGAYTSSAGTAVNGDTFRVRVTTSSSYSAGVTGTLTIGGVSDGFSATTAANSAPAFIGPNIATITLEEDVAMVPRNFASLFSDLDPLTFTAIGSLPTGLSLSSAGVLSGTPTTVGTSSSIEIRASDGTLTQDSNSFDIDIVEEIETNGAGASLLLNRRRGRR